MWPSLVPDEISSETERPLCASRNSACEFSVMNCGPVFPTRVRNLLLPVVCSLTHRYALLQVNDLSQPWAAQQSLAVLPVCALEVAIEGVG